MKKSAVSGSVVVGRAAKGMCADQPPINDEWIRFTDKPTINHQSIVYQQTGRIRSGSDSFVRFFHRVQPNAANTTTSPGITRSFTPFPRFSPRRTSALVKPLLYLADVKHPSLASTTKLEFMRKLLFFFPFFLFFFRLPTVASLQCQNSTICPGNRSAKLLFR